MSLERINIVEVETKSGYRSFELYQGDITSLSQPIDLLVVSAFADGYYPTPGTVLGALSTNLGISVLDLSRDPYLNLKNAFGCWVSNAIPHHIFSRILCLEFVGTGRSIAKIFENLFVVLGILELQGIQLKTIAIPMLGTGNQGLNHAEVIDHLLKCSIKFLEYSQHLSRVLLVAYRSRSAENLNRAMNKALHRVDVVIPKDQLMVGIRQEIQQKLSSVLNLTNDSAHETLLTLRRLIFAEDSKSFELGVAARRFTELMVDDVLREFEYDLFRTTLYRKIGYLKDLGIAEWITSYMHVLRVFGNESAHHQDQASRRPAVISESDLGLCLFCLERLLDFWIDLLRSPVANTSATRE